MNDMRGHNAIKGKQGFQPVSNPEPSAGMSPETETEGAVFDRRGNLIDPNACRHCEWRQGYHGYVFSEHVGGHLYVAPDDTLRLARMKARRASRA